MERRWGGGERRSSSSSEVDMTIWVLCGRVVVITDAIPRGRCDVVVVVVGVQLQLDKVGVGRSRRHGRGQLSIRRRACSKTGRGALIIISISQLRTREMPPQ